MFKTKEDIKQWCDDHFIEDYTINEDLTVDVDNDVFLYLLPIIYLPIQFGEINGEFLLGENGLKSLRGCPYIVHHDFTCGGNEITSLNYLPKIIEGTIRLFNNKKLIDFTSTLEESNNLIKSTHIIPGLTYLSHDEGDMYSYDTEEYLKWNDSCRQFFEEEEFIVGEPDIEIFL